MAGDWIKVEVTLPDKPEVVRMAEVLHLDQDAISGKCLRFWIWLNQQSENGNALSVTKTFIDRLCACDGFGDALEQVGWALFQNGTMQVPNFDRHNSKSAKQRALTQQRVKTHRDPSNESVTQVKRGERYRSVTREEKSTEGSGSARTHAQARTRVSKNDTTTTPPLAEIPNPEFEGLPFKAIIESWRELCPELPEAAFQTAARDRAIATFWVFCGAKIENVRRIFTLVGRSNLLNGRPHRTKVDRKPYKTRFDWVIRPDNAARIAEGEFSDEPAA